MLCSFGLRTCISSRRRFSFTTSFLFCPRVGRVEPYVRTSADRREQAQEEESTLFSHRQLSRGVALFSRQWRASAADTISAEAGCFFLVLLSEHSKIPARIARSPACSCARYFRAYAHAWNLDRPRVQTSIVRARNVERARACTLPRDDEQGRLGVLGCTWNNDSESPALGK